MDEAGGWRARRTPLLLLAAAVGLAVLFASCSGNGRSAEAELPVQCQALIRQELKAPATADFTGVTVEGGDGEYVVRGQVDSENSFGAKVRAPFRCDATWDEDSGTATGLTVDVG